MTHILTWRKWNKANSGKFKVYQSYVHVRIDTTSSYHYISKSNNSTRSFSGISLEEKMDRIGEVWSE